MGGVHNTSGSEWARAGELEGGREGWVCHDTFRPQFITSRGIEVDGRFFIGQREEDEARNDSLLR